MRDLRAVLRGKRRRVHHRQSEQRGAKVKDCIETRSARCGCGRLLRDVGVLRRGTAGFGIRIRTAPAGFLAWFRIAWVRPGRACLDECQAQREGEERSDGVGGGGSHCVALVAPGGRLFKTFIGGGAPGSVSWRR
jgi:hypothetical protein